MSGKVRYMLLELEWDWHRMSGEEYKKTWEFLGDLEFSDEPPYEIRVCKIVDDEVYSLSSAHDYVSYAATYALEADRVHGTFESLEEAELKLAIAGWKMEDVTASFPKDTFTGRTVLKAFELSAL